MTTSDLELFGALVGIVGVVLMWIVAALAGILFKEVYRLIKAKRRLVEKVLKLLEES